MKKYISFVLSTILALSTTVSYAEDDITQANDDAAISIDIVELDTQNELEDTEIENTVEDVSEDEIETESEQEENDSTVEVMSLETESTDSWNSAASMGTSRANCELIKAEDELYAAAGMGDSGFLNTIEKYNAESDSWQDVTTIPNDAQGMGITSNGSKIYTVGGYDGSKYLSDVYEYDTSTDTWTALPEMNEKRDQPAVLYMNSRIYVFGGRNKEGFVDSYEYYDFADDAWYTVTTGYNETMIRVGAHAQYIDGYVCIYGGINMDYTFAGVDMYSASNLNNSSAVIEDGYSEISIAWGADKALIFAWNDDSNAYEVSEMTVSDGNISVSDVIFENDPSSGKYTEYVIFGGYLYSVGGYSLTAKQYLQTVNVYSVYYGDYSVGDGTIESTVTESGNSITLNVEAGREYVLFINTKNMSSYDNCVFRIDYTEDAFTVTDGCAMTADKDTVIGAVDGSDIEILDIGSDGISFGCTYELNGVDSFAQTVNAVILQANSSGQRTIKYSMVRE